MDVQFLLLSGPPKPCFPRFFTVLNNTWSYAVSSKSVSAFSSALPPLYNQACLHTGRVTQQLSKERRPETYLIYMWKKKLKRQTIVRKSRRAHIIIFRCPSTWISQDTSYRACMYIPWQDYDRFSYLTLTLSQFYIESAGHNWLPNLCSMSARTEIRT